MNEIERTLKFYETYHQLSDMLPVFLLYGPSGSGKTRIIESLCSDLNVHLCKVRIRCLFIASFCNICVYLFMYAFIDKWCQFSGRVGFSCRKANRNIFTAISNLWTLYNSNKISKINSIIYIWNILFKKILKNKNKQNKTKVPIPLQTKRHKRI